MKIISKKVDNLEESTIVLSYIEWDEQLEEIRNFIQNLGEKVPVYGKNGEMLLLQVENILYFEAVGELVFAYTDDQVYEIKKRLYQLEQSLESHKIIRASESQADQIRATGSKWKILCQDVKWRGSVDIKTVCKGCHLTGDECIRR